MVFSGKDNRPLFAAFVCDDATATSLNPVLLAREWPTDSVRTGGIKSAVRHISAGVCPKILLVDLSESTDPRADMQSLAEVCEADTAVIAAGVLNDVSFFRDLIHAGVQDYLLKPLKLDAVDEAFETALEALEALEQQPEEEPVDGQSVAIIGLRGGLGASTLSANIAAWFAGHKQSTIFLDLDLYFGVAALNFDQDPGRGLIDALDNPARVDGLFLERAVVKPVEHMSILAAEAPIGTLGQQADGAILHLCQALQESYTNLVMDLPRYMLGQQGDALQAMTDIVLLTDLSLVGARDCIRTLGYLSKVAPKATVHIVQVRTSQAIDEVPLKDFENSIEHSIDFIMPHDPKTFMAATKEGKMITDVAKGSKPAQMIVQLCRKIIRDFDNDSAASKKGWVNKIFAR